MVSAREKEMKTFFQENIQQHNLFPYQEDNLYKVQKLLEMQTVKKKKTLPEYHAPLLNTLNSMNIYSHSTMKEANNRSASVHN